MQDDWETRPLATFSGLRGVPLLSLSYNSLFPSLRIQKQGIAIRVIRWHDFAYADIERIEAQRRLGQLLTFVPRRGVRTFSVNFPRASAVAVVSASQQRGAPLAPTALALLNARS